MKISIITVCFNSAKTINKTIRSVADQTYHDIEYIVIDGGSKDGTLDIIESNNDVICKWISESDKGLYDAMNKGIALCTGDYIGIINADDIFYDELVIENIAKFLCKNNVDASIGNIIQVRETGEIVRVYSSKSWAPSKLAIGFMPPHPSVFIKRSLFQKYGGYVLNLKIGADYELLTRFFLKHNITWNYLDLFTHKMLIGGLSSSGLKSYHQVTNDICHALSMNEVKFSIWKIKLRAVWKFFELFKHVNK